MSKADTMMVSLRVMGPYSVKADIVSHRTNAIQGA